MAQMDGRARPTVPDPPASSRSPVKAALGLQPRQHILPHVPLRLTAQIEARHAEPFDLARTHLKEVRNLLPSHDIAECPVALLLQCTCHVSPVQRSRC